MGNASAFAGMEANFLGDLDVFAIQTPGRGQRFHEKPVPCRETYVSAIIKSISPYLDTPFIFFGYSNGSLIAYEPARKLQSLYGIAPAHLVLTARRAPKLPPLRSNIAPMSHGDLLAELRKYSRTPDDFLQGESVMSVFMPMLRAEFALGEVIDFQEDPMLKLDATVFWGRQDGDTSEEGIQAWRHLIDGNVDIVEFESGHFFITTNTKSSRLSSGALCKMCSIRIYNRAQKRRYRPARTVGADRILRAVSHDRPSPASQANLF